MTYVWSKKQILVIVTGGFIGSHLVEPLAMWDVRWIVPAKSPPFILPSSEPFSSLFVSQRQNKK